MGKPGKREFVQVLRLMEVFRPDDVLAGVREAIARGVIGFVRITSALSSLDSSCIRPDAFEESPNERRETPTRICIDRESNYRTRVSYAEESRIACHLCFLASVHLPRFTSSDSFPLTAARCFISVRPFQRVGWLVTRVGPGLDLAVLAPAAATGGQGVALGFSAPVPSRLAAKRSLSPAARAAQVSEKLMTTLQSAPCAAIYKTPSVG